MNLKNENSRFIYLVVVIVFLLAVIGGVFYSSGIISKGNVQKIAVEHKISLKSAKTLTLEEKADAIVAEMSPAEKIGQMMMIGIKGNDVTDDSLYMLHEYHIGGIILFDRNMESKVQVQALTKSLQKQADQKIPLFIAVDEEGGDVVRMSKELIPPPSQLAIGKAGDPAAAEKWAVEIAQNLKVMGINVNFAPVADIGSNDSRSYSKNPDVVTEFVREAANGYEQEKIMYSLKHFPGIGRGQMDSHIDAYKIEASKAVLEAEDFVPFRTIIQEKNPKDYFIMVSHLSYPAMDEDFPASLSKKIMTGVLRDELGYQGLIITDDMEMGAVSKHFDFKELGVRAVEAGADIVMVCHEYEHETDVYNGMLKALQNGELNQDKVNEAVKRIVTAKLLHLL